MSQATSPAETASSASGQSLRDLPVPSDVGAALERHCLEIKKAAAEKLASMALYGGVVRGRYQPEQSDINLLLVLKDARREVLDRLAPVLHAAWREILLEPWLLGQDEVARAAVVFPTKVLDIKRYHRLLHGEDVLKNIEVRREDLGRRIEQEMTNLAMRLRRRYLTIYDDEIAMRRALVETAVPLRVNLLALLDLAGVKVAEEERTAPVYAAAAKQFQLDAGSLQVLSDLRHSGEFAGEVRDLYGSVMDIIPRVAAIGRQLGSAR